MAGIVIELTVDDKGTVKIKQFSDEAKKVFQQMTDGPKQAQGPMAAWQESWVGLTAKIGMATAAVYGVTKAISSFRDLAAEGAKVQSLQESFALMARNSGVAIDDLIAKLKQATNETVDDSGLMRKATRLMAESFSGEQIIQTAEAARVAARLMGTDVSVAYEQVVDSIVNLRERELKTAGFVIDLNDAFEKQARKLHVTKDDLSDYGKQMAMMEAVHERTIELQRKLGMETETASERIQKQKTAWQEAKEDLAKLVSVMYDWLQVKDKMNKMEDYSIEQQIYRMEAAKISSAVFGVEEGMAEPKAAGKSQIARRDMKKYFEEQKPYYESLAKQAAQLENLAYGGMENQAFFDQLEERKEIEKQINQALQDRVGWRAYEVPTLEQELEISRRSLDLETKRGDETRRIMLETARLTGDSTLQFKLQSEALDEEAKKLLDLGVSLDAVNKYVRASKDSMSEWAKFADDTINGIINSWSSGFSQMRRSGEDFGDWFKNMWLDIADSVIGQIMKITAQEALLGSYKNVSGAWSSGGGSGGLIGLIGSLFSQTSSPSNVGMIGLAMQEGGIVTRPTLGMIGEAGPEAVVPLRGGKVPVEGGGGDTYIIYNHVQVNDPNTFTRLYGPVVKKLSEESIAEARRYNKVSSR